MGGNEHEEETFKADLVYQSVEEDSTVMIRTGSLRELHAHSDALCHSLFTVKFTDP